VHFHLALTANLDPDRNMFAVYLYVDDPDALFREWSAASPEGCLEPPEDRDWGMREMTYTDPDGNLLRIGRVIAVP
jgi:catechol 2,3-dioxygenase-like lactoylglutathione lyase family enzyme